jgi:hypothetical protein
LLIWTCVERIGIYCNTNFFTLEVLSQELFYREYKYFWNVTDKDLLRNMVAAVTWYKDIERALNIHIAENVHLEEPDSNIREKNLELEADGTYPLIIFL